VWGYAYLKAYTCIALKGAFIGVRRLFLPQLLFRDKATAYNHEEFNRLVFSLNACALRIFCLQVPAIIPSPNPSPSISELP